MKFFIDEKEVQPKRPVSEIAATKVATLISRLQNGFAKRLNKTFGDMNTKRLKTAVVLFAILFGGLSLYFIINAVMRPSASALYVDKVNVPKHFDKSGDEEIVGTDYVDEETARNIIVFRKYMDSLKNFHRRQYDSIIAARPHLMDSVTILLSIYELQKQNSEYEK